MILPSDITLKAGDSGDYVAELQRRLAQRELLNHANVSGLFDGNTTQAVIEFQTLNGLRADGVAGPETLRRLISIGAAGSADGSSGADSSANDEEAKVNNAERFDTFMGASEPAQTEQAKLANEAVWGYGDNAAVAAQQQEQGQQQLSDLNRYNQVHDEALQMQRQQQQINQQPPSQLEFTAQGVQAQTMAKDMERPPEKAADMDRASEKAADKLADKDQPQSQKPPAAEVKSEVALTEPKPPMAQPEQALPRDPALARTEARLNATSRQESQQEGQKLDKKGVRDVGTVSEAALGELSPARSPAIQREQQVGIA